MQIVKLIGNPVNLNFTGGVTPKGVYSAGTTYATGDSVSYSGSSYVAIQSTTGNLPTNTTYWQVLANKGETGSQGSQGIQGIQGNAGPQGSAGSNGSDGADGKEIELQKGTTYIQWRYVGDVSWTNLVALTDLKGNDGSNGTNGADGKEVELQKGATYVQWRYVGDLTWNDLVAIADLKGDAGTNGADGQGVPTGGSTGQYLKKKSNSNFDTEWGSPSGSGDVVGPSSAVDSNFAGFDTTTGKLIKDSGSKASDFATAGHNHTGTYEPADATLQSSKHTHSNKTALDAVTGTNTGDQDLSGLVTKTTTVNTKALSGNISLTQDDVGDGTTYKQYSATEKTKLSGIEAGANNYTHPATHSADIIVDGSTNKAYTATEKTKLAGIAAGAEVNVQADWNQTTDTSDDYIKNKPTIPTQYTDEMAQDAVGSMVTGNTESGITVEYDDANAKLNFTVASQTDNNFTTVYKNKLDGIAAGAEVNVNADWTAVSGDAQILNKPTLGDSAAKNVGTTAGTVSAGDHNHTGVYAPVLGADDNYVTDAEKTALHSHSNKTALDNVTGTNSGDQVVPTNEAGASNNFLTAYNSTTGAFSKAQPTWANINKSTSSIADITTRSHTALSDIGTNAHSAIDTALTRLANTSGTNTGDQDLSSYCPKQLVENDPILLDAAGSADGKYSGIAIAGTAGATLAFGDLCYLNDTDSRWELADANLSDGYDCLLGICVLAANADGDATRMLLFGNVRADTAFPSMTIGKPVYMSETAGDVTSTQPTTADVAVRVVGFALTADELFFNPDNIYFTHT